MSRPVIARCGKGEPPGTFGYVYESDGRLTSVPEAHDNGKAGMLSYVAARGREINFAKEKGDQDPSALPKIWAKNAPRRVSRAPPPSLHVMLPVDCFRAA